MRGSVGATSPSGFRKDGRGPLPAAHLAQEVRFLRAAVEVERIALSAATGGNGESEVVVTGRGRRFTVEARWSRRDGALERWDVRLDVTHAGAEPTEAGVELRVRLDPTEDPRWLIPGLFYGANRGPGSTARYPAFGPAAGDDPWTRPAWSFRADRAAIPTVFARDDEQGIALATTETGPLGLNGLGFEASAGGPILRLSFPYREEPVAYDGSGEPRPPDLPTHRWNPGEMVGLHVRVYRTAPGPYAWAPVLDDLREDPAGIPEVPSRRTLDPLAAADFAAEGLLRWHSRPSPPVLIETADFDRPVGDDLAPAPRDRLAMHVAWLSGAPPAAALLAHGRRTGNATAIEVGSAVLDHIATNLAPCGTFWGQWTADRGWTKGWTHGEDRLHARTLGEATTFMTRAVLLSDDAGAAGRWRAAIASNLEFISARQREDGAIPAAWHARTGEPAAWGGCAGLAWVPALVEGASLLGRGDLAEPARRAGAFYAQFVDAVLLYGAPEDVELGPTSEDGYVAVMAYIALTEATPAGPERDRWVDLATRAAEWMLTFRYTWNVAFDPASTLGRLGFLTRGLDQASPANQHLHTYGLVALAETIRLGRLTGDHRLIERSQELFSAARQLIARFDGDFGARRGMVPERAYQTASFGPKGEIDRMSHAWCLGLLLWACELAADLPELAEAAG